MTGDKTYTSRIITIDDNPAIHVVFRSILIQKSNDDAFEATAAALFGEDDLQSSLPQLPAFELASASQGREGCDMVKHALQEDNPFALAFVDMRMPPGWDGLETIENLWRLDPNLQIVICSAYSDYSWGKIVERLGHTDNLLILKKPFDNSEVAQLAAALTKKWHLQRRTRMMMQNLEAARQAAETATKAKSEFVTTMSHEIRTPLNGIMGAVSMISDMKGSEAQKEYFEIIQSCCEALNDVVGNILDHAMIEAQKFSIETSRFDLQNLLNSIMLVTALEYEDSQVQLKYDLDPTVPQFVHGDPNRLRQVLTNLIGNAFKYTFNGEVRIAFNYTNHNGKQAFFARIEDTGIGIEKDQIPHIFDEFVHADTNLTKLHAGSGLGLTIANRLVQLMGGQLTVESQPGSGSTFSLWIPLEEDWERPAVEKAQSTSEQIPIHFNDARILVVEDNLINQKVARHILTSLGCCIDTADNGQIAVEKVMAEKYALVFMDCQMPVMDGFQAAHQIRSQEKNGEHLCIVALTANATPEDRKKCLDVGMDDFVPKPVNKLRLQKVLQRWLGSIPPST